MYKEYQPCALLSPYRQVLGIQRESGVRNAYQHTSLMDVQTFIFTLGEATSGE